MVPLNVISKFASTHFDSEPPWSLPSPSSAKTSQKDGEVSATMSGLLYYAAEITKPEFLTRNWFNAGKITSLMQNNTSIQAALYSHLKLHQKNPTAAYILSFRSSQILPVCSGLLPLDISQLKDFIKKQKLPAAQEHRSKLKFIVYYYCFLT